MPADRRDRECMGTLFCHSFDRVLTRMKTEVVDEFRLNWACQQRIVHLFLQSLWRNFFTLDLQAKQNEALNTDILEGGPQIIMWKYLQMWPIETFLLKLSSFLFRKGCQGILNVTVLTTRGMGCIYPNFISLWSVKMPLHSRETSILSYPAPRDRIRKNVQNQESYCCQDLI